VMSCSLPFPHRSCPQHGSRQVCIPGSAVRPVRPPRLPEDVRPSSLAVPGPGASPAVVCCLINLQTRCRAPLFLHLPSRATSAGLRKFLSLAFVNDRPWACAFGILQPLGRRVSACSSRYKLLNGLSCPPGSPDLATKPPAGLSPIVPVALATDVTSCPASPFMFDRSLPRGPYSQIALITAPPGYFQLAAALNRLILHTLRCMTIQRSVPDGIRRCHNRFIYGRTLPDRSGRPHAINAR